MQKIIVKSIQLTFLALLIFSFSSKSFANISQENISTSDAISQIQKTLLFSNSDEAKKASQARKQSLEINRSDYRSEDIVDIKVINPKIQNKDLEYKEELAYNAVNAGQYEAALEVYKQILKDDPNNIYVQFALGATYQKLRQFSQAKKIYYKLLKQNIDDDKTRDEIIGNMISLIVEESPNEAVYLLNRLSNQNPKSAYILAGAAMAYDKLEKSDQAILLLTKAINIDPRATYQFNLAVIFDKIGDYKNALQLYQNVVANYSSSSDIASQIPIIQVKNRIEFIKGKFKI